MKDRLDTSLHTTAFLLNPYFYYKDSSIALYGEVAAGIFECMEVLHADEFELQDTIINKEFEKYRDKTGLFGKALAAKACEKNDDTFDPCAWWSTYGAHTPNLLRVALRILSLTTSSSGCERNWSAFEGIHTKKRNRLDVHRLNNLVFVQFNARLFNKQKREKERNVDVLLQKDASNAQGWIVDGGEENEVEPGSGITWQLVDEATGADENLQPRRSSRVRELHDANFESEEEDDDQNDDIDFVSDEEQVVEHFGEEEVE
ncbi:uncharacterized protein LOC142543269 isoform X1 [Primulina tabacum]|uniref:uncharacterized protein LOC142543269 isoform X1 n=2 Tax=Primulina tabacum TaxID=48773 RepID=UPI003F59CCAF